MNKQFRKYDKFSQRTVYMETEDFNKILEEANAKVSVVPRDVELRNQYTAYVDTCKANDEEVLSEGEYEDKYFCASCSFVTSDNIPASVLLARALDVAKIEVAYAKDWYGNVTNTELEITYSAT